MSRVLGEVGYTSAWGLGKQDRAQAGPQGTQTSLTGSHLPSEVWSASKQERTGGRLGPCCLLSPHRLPAERWPISELLSPQWMDYADVHDAAEMMATGPPSTRRTVNSMTTWLLCL